MSIGNYRHGHRAQARQSPEYASWRAMLRRCVKRGWPMSRALIESSRNAKQKMESAP
jgi:hypothetical protein